MISPTPPPGKYRVVTWALTTPRVMASAGDFDGLDQAIAEARRIFAAGEHDASVFGDRGRALFVGHLDGPPIVFARMKSASSAQYRR